MVSAALMAAPTLVLINRYLQPRQHPDRVCFIISTKLIINVNVPESWCPPPSLTAPDDCAGVVSTCWSPGLPDTGEASSSSSSSSSYPDTDELFGPENYINRLPDCPNNGLCCFNGCADICLEDTPPTSPPAIVRGYDGSPTKPWGRTITASTSKWINEV